ncbi:phosphoribosylanthranilate isomerase [Desulfobacterales bacterium HSG17]|nr:phosphoribosylanthranilate isomerase [Desulfobacterales bacterium HSG17]
MEKDLLNIPQIKVCGLTEVSQALECAALGVNAIGCVFFPKSPRNLSEAQAKEICSALPPEITSVGVFVNETYSFIMKKVENCGLKAVQLHGQESPELVKQLRRQDLKVIMGLFMSREPGLDKAEKYDPDAFLIECGQGKLPGGNAKTWDWSSARAFGEKHPFILAGGLSPDNIQSAVAQAQPDAVDVSSGVELTPGKKDIEKVKKFIQKVKDCHIDRQRRIL